MPCLEGGPFRFVSAMALFLTSLASLCYLCRLPHLLLALCFAASHPWSFCHVKKLANSAGHPPSTSALMFGVRITATTANFSETTLGVDDYDSLCFCPPRRALAKPLAIFWNQ